MAFQTWRSYQKFEEEVKNSFRYIHSEESKEFLSEVRRTSIQMTRTLKKGTPLYRAQIAHDYREVQDSIEIECPAPMTRMFPKLEGATEGRANSKGISCLYLANNPTTAISEVRPWSSALVSIATMNMARDLRIIDCSLYQGRHHLFFHADNGFYEPEGEERNEAVWAGINNAFSHPVENGKLRADYAPTQILTELFRSEGFDGICFKSSLSEGHNIALFDVKMVQPVRCDIREVKKVEYLHEECEQGYWMSNGSPQE